jgi:hypothetical protein
MRVNTDTGEYGGGFGINSRVGTVTPSLGEDKRYRFYFKPIVTDPGGAPGYTNLVLSFDMINFKEEDSEDGVIFLDQIHVDKIPDYAFIPFTEIMNYDFESSQGSWNPGDIAPIFSAPTQAWGYGALGLTSVDTNSFGWWTSPWITVKGDVLYEIIYSVSTSVPSPEQSPAVRMRVNSRGSDMYWYTHAESTGSASASPQITPSDYKLYFSIPQSMIDLGIGTVNASFDLINLDASNDPTGVLYLENVIISEGL